ncbi:MAG TPA: dihydroorotase [Actinomycetota bacterium]|nr:dihydroorotase [Actinomycetota bacterium]
MTTDAPTAIVLRGGRLVDPRAGRDEVADVRIADGRISAVGVDVDRAGAQVLDVDGAVVTPGLVDLHAHLREPGYEHKETIATGSRAAAVGGYTAVAAMANTMPVADHAAIVHEIRDLASAAGLCEVFPVGAITKGLAGESLAEIGEMVEAGVRVFSDDGNPVPTARLLRNALTYAKAFGVEVVIADHAEDPSLVEGGQMHEGLASASLGLAGRPAEAEEIAVARDLAVTRMTGGRLHLCHLSTARSVELVRRAKDEGVRVTAEVTPHHLVFTDDDLRTYDTNLKMNPPVRSADDRDALRAGLVDGAIDAVATDHAPHAVEEKESEFDRSPPGTIGLETALAVIVTELVAPGAFDLSTAIVRLSCAPAQILGAHDHGGPVEPGRPAHLAVFDPGATWSVEPPFASRARNSAFIGRELRGRVIHTFLAGRATVSEGKATG